MWVILWSALRVDTSLGHSPLPSLSGLVLDRDDEIA